MSNRNPGTRTVERRLVSPSDLTHEKWHPARGRCLTSNVTLGSSKSEPRGKSEVFDELPWQTRVVDAGSAALWQCSARATLDHPGRVRGGHRLRAEVRDSS